MRFTIEGFSQAELVRLGLDATDAVLLRWFADFFLGSMQKRQGMDMYEYGWVSYPYVAAELPCLGLHKPEAIAARFRKLRKANVLLSFVTKKPESKAWYRPNPAVFDRLVSGPTLIEKEVPPSSPLGYHPNENGDNSSIRDTSIKDLEEKRIYKSGVARFQQPSLQEVQEYCSSRQNHVDPGRFIDHYESCGWMVGRNRMKDWKAAVRTWERNDFGNGRSGPKLKVHEHTTFLEMRED